jgi:hypothetical protein
VGTVCNSGNQHHYRLNLESWYTPLHSLTSSKMLTDLFLILFLFSWNSLCVSFCFKTGSGLELMIFLLRSPKLLGLQTMCCLTWLEILLVIGKYIHHFVKLCSIIIDCPTSKRKLLKVGLVLRLEVLLFYW